jgi:hypothetical protein
VEERDMSYTCAIMDELKDKVGEICYRCQEKKSIDEFYERKDRGRVTICKVCTRIQGRKYTKENRIKLYEQKRIYRNDSKNKLKAQLYNKEYRKLHREKILKRHKEYHKLNSVVINARNKNYRELNKKAVMDYAKNYYKQNKFKIGERTKAYQRSHREKVNNRHKTRLKVDINYKLACSLRNRMKEAIKNNQKGGSAVRDLGCSVNECRLYIEKQFKDGMNWENYGRNGWHFDHIIPLSSFNLGDPVECKKACHYSNLQPLWWYENLSKGSKIGESGIKENIGGLVGIE